MKVKIDSYIFYLLLPLLLQLDLFMVNFNLQTILCVMILLLIYNKQKTYSQLAAVTLTFIIEKFILLHKLGLDILLLLFTCFLSSFLKKNITVKSFAYYLLLIIYILLHTTITNTYFFKIDFLWQTFLTNLSINILAAVGIRHLYDIINNNR